MRESSLLPLASQVRDELSRRCEEGVQPRDAPPEDGAFGQSEKLADRIRGLLSDYNGPIDVLLEHWQNCDVIAARFEPSQPRFLPT